jgi:hypothetical protein
LDGSSGLFYYEDPSFNGVESVSIPLIVGCLGRASLSATSGNAVCAREVKSRKGAGICHGTTFKSMKSDCVVRVLIDALDDINFTRIRPAEPESPERWPNSTSRPRNVTDSRD